MCDSGICTNESGGIASSTELSVNGSARSRSQLLRYSLVHCVSGTGQSVVVRQRFSPCTQ